MPADLNELSTLSRLSCHTGSWGEGEDPHGLNAAVLNVDIRAEKRQKKNLTLFHSFSRISSTWLSQ
jgi:hypothetical protein